MEKGNKLTKKIFDPNNIKSGFYYARRDSIIRVIDNKLFTGVVVVDDVPVDVEEGIIRIKLPKIPANVIREIHDFFKYAYIKYTSEAVVMIWYNFNTNKWSVEVPKQTTTGASVDYERNPKDEEIMRSEGFTFVGTIHSHGEMGAFHSGTDDADEIGFDGLHITIGKVMTGPEFACRFVMKDLQLKREPEDVLIMPEIVDTVPKEWKDKIKKFSYNAKNNIQTDLVTPISPDYDNMYGGYDFDYNEKYKEKGNEKKSKWYYL